MKRWILLMLLVAGACGDGHVDGAGSAGVPVSIDPTLDIGFEARVEPGVSIGVWNVEITGDVARISRWQLFGDEAGTETLIEIDLGEDPPALIQAFATSRDAYAATNERPLAADEVVLNNANPNGIISGRLVRNAEQDIDFWVDTKAGTVIEPDIDEPFTMIPGAVLDDFTWALQYEGIVEDSRCPADVECITAGTVRVSFGYLDPSGRTTVTASGIMTPAGPLYGEQPLIDFAGSRYMEILDVTDAGVTVVVRSIDE